MDFTVARIKELLTLNGFSFNKGLGQNFLINPSVCPRMAAACGCDGIGVLEIGPGAGVLTAELAKRARKVVAVELDKRLQPVLNVTLAEAENTTVVFADALKLDLKSFIADNFGDMPVVVCANLPYYISTELIMSFLEQDAGIKRITVMLQKELAARLCAAPPCRECGAVSVAVHYRTKPSALLDVSRGSFVPSPNVDSRVITLEVLPRPAVSPADETVIFKVVRAGFGQRRKTLSNSLAQVFGKQNAALALTQSGVDGGLRAEQLSLAQFAAIADALTAQSAE